MNFLGQQIFAHLFKDVAHCEPGKIDSYPKPNNDSLVNSCKTLINSFLRERLGSNFRIRYLNLEKLLSIVEIRRHDIYSSYINMNLISKTHYYYVRKKILYHYIL